MPTKHAVQRMNFEETSSHQKSLHVLHSPSDQGHLPSTGISSQPFYLSLKNSLLLSSFSTVLSQQKQNKSPKQNNNNNKKHLATRKLVSEANKAAAGTPHSKAFPGQKNVADAKAALLGKAQPCCSTSTFHPLRLSQGLSEKTFFLFFYFFFFFVLISSNKNNEFLKPCKNVTRCQQSQPGR